MPKRRGQRPNNDQRLSLAHQEGIARLQENGVTGDEHELTLLLESANFDIGRAVSMHMDQHGGATEAATTLPNAHGLLNGEDQLVRKPTDKEGKCEPDDTRPRYAQLSQKSHSSMVSLIRTGDEGLPTGVHYEVGLGRSCESYDVDVVRMQQTHLETGSIRKIRREKKGVWRYDKRGSSWGIYPGIVSVELERIFLTLRRKGGPVAQDIRKDSLQKEDAKDFQAITDPITFSDVSLDDLEYRVAVETFTLESLASASEQLFLAAEAGGLVGAVRAAALLESFVVQHGFKCDTSHARRAGLVVGSMRLLQVVVHSTPNLSLVGEDIFDKKYPKLSLQDVGRKNCIRCLLSRGMHLGSNNFVPHGKLLRKVEADAVPAWTQRYLNSMIKAYPQLPEGVCDRVLLWVGT